MTGFGAAEGPVHSGRLRVEIRTVNHRFFNLSLKVPADMGPLEGEFRELLRREFDRGHVTVHARWLEAPAAAIADRFDVERARQVVRELKNLQAALDVPGTIDLALVLRQPAVVVPVEAAAPELDWNQVRPVVESAAQSCRAMRQREGVALADELRHRLAQLEAATERVAAAAPERLTRERERLRQHIAVLVDGTPVEEARLAQELAFLADRLDITEELVRLRAHLAACHAALAGSAPVGKQLGFLAQEMGREVNTIGSKANDAGIAEQVILMKGELEKFREQLENLE